MVPGSILGGRTCIGLRRKPCALVQQATPRGFEPLRAEPNGFLVHLLSRSDTVSLTRERSPCNIRASARMVAARRPERLRRWTRTSSGSARRGSTPLGVVLRQRLKGLKKGGGDKRVSDARDASKLKVLYKTVLPRGLQDVACPPLRKTLGGDAQPGKPAARQTCDRKGKTAWEPATNERGNARKPTANCENQLWEGKVQNLQETHRDTRRKPAGNPQETRRKLAGNLQET